MYHLAKWIAKKTMMLYNENGKERGTMETKLDISPIFAVIQVANIVLMIAILVAFVLFFRWLILRNRKK